MHIHIKQEKFVYVLEGHVTAPTGGKAMKVPVPTTISRP